MKKLHLSAFILLILLCQISCVNQNRYYMAKQGDFFNTYYTLAERFQDSVRIWYIRENINAGFWEEVESEKIPLQPGTYKNIQVLTIEEKLIKTDKMVLRPAKDLQRFHYLRNQISAINIRKQFHDSVSLALGNRKILFNLAHLADGQYDDVRKMALSFHSDSFPNEYKKHLEQKLEEIRQNLDQKKKYYFDLLTGKISLNESSFQQFMDVYDYTYYDRQILYYFITKKPELYFGELNLNLIESDISFCEDCFTKKELKDMYCSLIPFRNEENKHRFWIFERRGDLSCER